MNPTADPQPDGMSLPLLAAADLQDHLMTASNDLERLQALLADASEVLARSFHGACERASALAGAGNVPDDAAARDVMRHLCGAVTALQFQDLASQLICHTNRRLRSCADRIARAAMGDDDDEDGPAVVAEPPPTPNPVTQDEMDAGSIELF